MNKQELHGDVRYASGKVEKAAGDVLKRGDWQADGVIDQIVGAAEHTIGRARSIAEDTIEAAPAFADEAREVAQDAARHVKTVAHHVGSSASDAVRRTPRAWAMAAVVAAAVAIAALVRVRRA